ncbi:hypothetical protein ACOSP7_016990 [Xanthoceras sorbifolium]
MMLQEMKWKRQEPQEAAINRCLEKHAVKEHARLVVNPSMEQVLMASVSQYQLQARLACVVSLALLLDHSPSTQLSIFI